MAEKTIPETLLQQLRGMSTCVAASAIEKLGVRLSNAGFTDSSVRCFFPELPAVCGYAVTARVRSSTPPMEGGTYYYWRTDWWRQILRVPSPRIVVIQDLDHPPGLGAFLGQVHANILQALGCVGLLTNGAVRDLPETRDIGFQLFAGNVSVSHAYAHLLSFGETVEVGRLTVKPGELLLGDMHGVLSIPIDIAASLPSASQRILLRRQRVIEICRAEGFTVDKLEAGHREQEALEAEEHGMWKPAAKRGDR